MRKVGLMAGQTKTYLKVGLAILSVLLNVVFVAVFLNGFDTARCPDQLVPHDSKTLMLCEPAPGSELAEVLPNVIYLASDGQIVVELEYKDVDRGDLRRLQLWDVHDRPWIDGELDEGSMIYNFYANDSARDPSHSLRDKDGDGIVDVKVDWDSDVGFERVGEIEWKRLVKGEKVP